MKNWRLLTILLFVGTTGAWAQPGLQWTEALSKSIKKESKSIPNFSSLKIKIKVLYSHFQFQSVGHTSSVFSQNNLTDNRKPLGIFCNLDLNLDQNLPFKLRFRLGEYHYTQYLEYGIENFLSRSDEIK